MCDLTTHAHLDAFIIESPSVQSLEPFYYVPVMNMKTPNTSRNYWKIRRQTTAQERTKEGSMCDRDSRAKTEKINEAEGER